jgi:hypothetical protein
MIIGIARTQMFVYNILLSPGLLIGENRKMNPNTLK